MRANWTNILISKTKKIVMITKSKWQDLREMNVKQEEIFMFDVVLNEYSDSELLKRYRLDREGILYVT